MCLSFHANSSCTIMNNSCKRHHVHVPYSGASFQLFLEGKIFFLFFNGTGLLKNWKNRTLFVLIGRYSQFPFFFSVFLVFLFFLSFFPWGRQPPPQPPQMTPLTVLYRKLFQTYHTQRTVPSKVTSEILFQKSQWLDHCWNVDQNKNDDDDRHDDEGCWSNQGGSSCFRCFCLDRLVVWIGWIRNKKTPSFTTLQTVYIGDHLVLYIGDHLVAPYVNVNVTDTILWQGHHDRVMQLNWLYICGICQMMPPKVWLNTAVCAVSILHPY